MCWIEIISVKAFRKAGVNVSIRILQDGMKARQTRMLTDNVAQVKATEWHVGLAEWDGLEDCACFDDLEEVVAAEALLVEFVAAQDGRRFARPLRRSVV